MKRKTELAVAFKVTSSTVAPVRETWPTHVRIRLLRARSIKSGPGGVKEIEGGRCFGIGVNKGG